MSSVVVLSKDAIMALINVGVVNGDINDSGELVLTTHGGDSINLGTFDHGELAGLGDDDHAQYALADGSRTFAHNNLSGLAADDHAEYALADGSRGSFATVAQGAKADAARKNSGAQVDILGGDTNPTGYVEFIIITNDGTPTAGWINRREFQFKDNAGADPRTVTANNEYGEIRGASAKHNTTWFRAFVEYNPLNVTGARNMDIPVLQMMDNRTNRNHIWGLYPAGDIRIMTNQIPTAHVIVLGALDSVPVGTPAGTVIVRTA